LRKRNEADGYNYVLLARLLVVLLYELWETGYRTPIAAAAGVSRDNLLVPVFGDLRFLRNEILHNKARLSPATPAKLKVITPRTGSSVDFDQTGVAQMVHQVRAALDELVQQFAGEDPAYRTVWHVT
jgi:hypothetical protein